MAEVTVFDKLTELADSIRYKTGATGALSLNRMIEEVNNFQGGGTELNYKVVARRPDIPTENTIHVETDTPITKYAFSVENPWVTQVETELVGSLTQVAGYFSDTGAITAQSSTNLEVYTEEYIRVRPGIEYTWTYTLSASKSMWFSIMEYDSSYNILGTRIEKVNSVTGTTKTGTYTPSAGNVKYIRLTWRTFGLENTVTFTGLVESSVPDETEGAVWFRTAYYSYADFNALPNNQLQVYPVQAKQYENGVWVEKTCYSYQSGEWKQWVPYGALYWYGNTCLEASGGWKGKGRARNSEATSYKYAPVVTNTSDYLLITNNPSAETQSNGLVETLTLQDLTDVSLIEVDCEGEVTVAIRVALCAIKPDAYLDNSVSNLVLLYPTTNATVPQILSRGKVYIDVSSLTGQYNIAFKASDTWSGGFGTFSLKVYSIVKIYND